ncbi:MAG: leucine-rich repeat domain-containing protein [Anaerolineae bacterium]
MPKDEAYQLAKQKIADALRSGATELDLSRMKLTELPQSIGQLTQLTSLDLSNNGLTALPDALGQLTQLTSLNLSNNQLTALPDSLGQLTELTELDIPTKLTSPENWQSCNEIIKILDKPLIAHNWQFGRISISVQPIVNFLIGLVI